MEQSTALAQPRLLAFGSHSSFPTIDFWQQLAKRKLDEYGLSDAPQPIHASYKPPPQEASHLSRVQLAGDAFASAGAGCVRARGIALLRDGARVDAARAPALVSETSCMPECRIPGTVRNVNTLEVGRWSRHSPATRVKPPLARLPLRRSGLQAARQERAGNGRRTRDLG